MIDIPKQRSSETIKSPLRWHKEGSPDGRTGEVIIFTCSNGHEGGLFGWNYKNHTIADDGTVNPSVVCTTLGCTFHEFVRLLEYSPISKL
jgi:hypothetical protein